MSNRDAVVYPSHISLAGMHLPLER